MASCNHYIRCNLASEWKGNGVNDVQELHGRIMKVDLEVTEEKWRLRVVIESKRKRGMETERHSNKVKIESNS